jgi:hypothetical protein
MTRKNRSNPARGYQANGNRSRQMAAPLSLTQLYVNAPPRSLPGKEGGVRFAHREFVGDFDGGAAFSVTGAPVNPGIPEMFPWLSYIALVYESYRFHRCKFILVPLQPATQTGQMFAVVDYDAADVAPGSKYEMLNKKGATACAVWMSLELALHAVDERALGRQRYVRHGSLADNLDIKTYDVGNLFVGSQGLASTVSTFSLFVEYDVELFVPDFSVSTIAGAMSVKLYALSGISKTAIFGTAGTQQIAGGLDVEADGNTLTFNRPGQYLVSTQISGTGITDDAAPAVSGTATSTVLQNVFANGTGTKGALEYAVEILEKGQTFIQDVSGAVTTVTGAFARVAPYLYLAA